MNRKLENQLANRFPQLFWDNVSCSIGDGWYDLFHDMCEELMTLDLPEGFKFTQIKEKFASLRVYTSPYSKETQAVIEKAETRSHKTCEMCGTTANVEQRSGRWMVTRCDDCEAVVQEEYTAGWIDPPDKGEE